MNDEHTPVMSPAEISVVQEVSRYLAEHHNAILTVMAQTKDQIAEMLAANEASTTREAIKRPRQLVLWRWVAGILAVLSAGGLGSAQATAGLIDRYDEQVRTQAFEAKAAAEREQTVSDHVAAAHVAPAHIVAVQVRLDELAAQLDAVAIKVGALPVPRSVRRRTP